MRHSLRAHVLYLENTIQSLRERLTKPRLSAEEAEDLQLQLTLAESALEHYRQAYELELSVSGPEPPDRPESKWKGSAGGEGKGKDKRNKEGLLIVACRARRRVRARLRAALPNPAVMRTCDS